MSRWYWDLTCVLLGQTTPAEPISELLKYGLLGLLIAATALGWVWWPPAVNELKEDKRAAQAENAQLIALIEKKVIPFMEQTVGAVDKLTTTVEQLRVDLARVGHRDSS